MLVSWDSRLMRDAERPLQLDRLHLGGRDERLTPRLASRSRRSSFAGAMIGIAAATSVVRMMITIRSSISVMPRAERRARSEERRSETRAAQADSVPALGSQLSTLGSHITSCRSNDCVMLSVAVLLPSAVPKY